MKKNSYNRAVIASLMTVLIALGALLWPTTGHSQSSSRRDRFRRDTSSRFESSRTDRGSRQASGQKAAATKPVEPNAGGAKAGVTAAQPKAANEAAAPRPDEITMESLTDEESGPLARYSIILQRNIFSRQRTPFRPRDRSAESQVVAVPNPETHFVLKGVVQENNQFIAFIEDTQGGGVLRLRQGDPVARGTIKTLSLDALEYQLEDKTISVRLGCDLEGTRAPVAVTVTVDEVPILSQTPAPAPTGAPASTATQQPKTVQQTPAPAGNEADILKRLMEQRRQQLGQ